LAASVTYMTIDGELVAEKRGGVVTTYVPDTQGSLVQCHSSTGTKVYEAWYWSYGEIRASTGTNPSPWGFVGTLGYYTDALNHLYVRARYYRPNLTRWQTVDPVSPRPSAYSYAGGDPKTNADPTGATVCRPNPIIRACLHACIASCENGKFGDYNSCYDLCGPLCIKLKKIGLSLFCKYLWNWCFGLRPNEQIERCLVIYDALCEGE